MIAAYGLVMAPKGCHQNCHQIQKVRMRQPFYVKSRKSWYVWIDGKQERLGPDKKKAFDKFHQRMTNKEINGEVPVVRLLDAALEWMETRRAGKTYARYSDHLNSFAASIGGSLTVIVTE